MLKLDIEHGSEWRRIYDRTKTNARRRNILFDLSHADYLELIANAQDRCTLTGIPFEFERIRGSYHPWRPSIDRIDSRQGYTKANCRLVCVAVNFAMNQWGVDVLNRMAEQLVKMGTFRQRNGQEYIRLGEYLKSRNITVDSKQRYEINKEAARLSEARNLDTDRCDHAGNRLYAKSVLVDAVKEVLDTERVFSGSVIPDVLLSVGVMI